MCIPTQKLHIFTDAKTALKSAEKLGPGRMRHKMVASLFVKKCARNEEAVINKVGAKANPADSMTKSSDGAKA